MTNGLSPLIKLIFGDRKLSSFILSNTAIRLHLNIEHISSNSKSNLAKKEQKERLKAIGAIKNELLLPVNK